MSSEPIRMFVTEVEAYNEIDDRVFTVKVVDENVYQVELGNPIFDQNSWEVLSKGVAQAMKSMSEEMKCPDS